MKKLIYLIVAIVALGLVIAGCIPTVPPTEQGELGNLEIVNVSKSEVTPIVIDGILSLGEWDSYFWFTDNSEGPGTGYDDDPLPVFTGYLHFDDTNLYLAFDVEDTTPNTNRDFLYITIDIPTAMIFNDPIDALYWGSTPTNASFFGEAYLTENDFPWDRSQRGSTWGIDGGVETARTITGTNRYYELRIPLIAISAILGDTIGIKIQARRGEYTSQIDPEVINFYPDMPDGITSAVRADTRVEVEDNFYQVTLVLPPIKVSVDIKPGSDPNSINLGSKGVVPVAVLTTDDFDASTADPDTVEFAGASLVRWTLEDVDGDGDFDMLFHFKTQELDLDEYSIEATLTGETWDGDLIEGTDTVNIVQKNKV